MSERYTKLLPLDLNLYVPGSPVVILAGSLLRDNETGNVLSRFIFRNISNKVIKALLVKVDAFDITGKELTGVDEYQYLDLSVQRNEEFGQNTAVPMPEAITRSVKIQCTSVYFTDGTQWTAPQDAVWSPLPAQQKISDTVGFALAQQYRRMTTDQAEYVPADCGNLWLCACGGINYAEEAACTSCGFAKTELIQALDEEKLSAGLDKYRADMEALEAEEEREKRAQAKKKTRNIIITGVATAVILTIVFFTTILPGIEHSKKTAEVERMVYGAESTFFNHASFVYNYIYDQEIFYTIEEYSEDRVSIRVEYTFKVGDSGPLYGDTCVMTYRITSVIGGESGSVDYLGMDFA